MAKPAFAGFASAFGNLGPLGVSIPPNGEDAPMQELAAHLVEATVGLILWILVPAAIIAGVGALTLGDARGALAGLAFGAVASGWRLGVVPIWRRATSREVPATFVEIIGRATFGAVRRGWAVAAFDADGKRVELKIRERRARRFARSLVPGARGELRFSGRLLQSWEAVDAG